MIILISKDDNIYEKSIMAYNIAEEISKKSNVSILNMNSKFDIKQFYIDLNMEHHKIKFTKTNNPKDNPQIIIADHEKIFNVKFKNICQALNDEKRDFNVVYLFSPNSENLTKELEEINSFSENSLSSKKILATAIKEENLNFKFKATKAYSNINLVNSYEFDRKKIFDNGFISSNTDKNTEHVLIEIMERRNNVNIN